MGLSGHFGRCGIYIPRQRGFDRVDGMVGDASHHFPQIGFGIQTIEFRRTDQAEIAAARSPPASDPANK